MSNNTINLIGWILFIISAIGFVIFQYRQLLGDVWQCLFPGCLPCVPDPLLPRESRLRHFKPVNDAGG